MLQWWTLAMVAFPDVQKHAQAELDAVVGRGRLPSFADRAHLPYTVALLREVLRWRTGLPLGVPHMSEADDFYEGMFIPKGSIILGNIMLCNGDVEVYGADAHIFKPERHLDELGQLAPALPSTKDHGHVSFGFGRRVCVGQHVAADALFIAIATLLWAYTFEKERGVEGREMEVDAEGYDVAGFILCVLCLPGLSQFSLRSRTPKHFECAIKPRFPDAIAILAAEKERQA
ncbi:cytochrome P450 [Peniophora sp. CONT]|nr:cytochrome P450 [Peniophora sp. CONT]